MDIDAGRVEHTTGDLDRALSDAIHDVTEVFSDATSSREPLQ